MYWTHLIVISGLSKGRNRDWRQIFHSKVHQVAIFFNTFLSLLFHIHLLVQTLHSFLALQLFFEGRRMSLVALHLFVEPPHFLAEAQHLHPSGLFLDMTCPHPLLVVIQLEQWNFHFPSKTKNTFEQVITLHVLSLPQTQAWFGVQISQSSLILVSFFSPQDYEFETKENRNERCLARLV